jgi:hypothetical protein
MAQKRKQEQKQCHLAQEVKALVKCQERVLIKYKKKQKSPTVKTTIGDFFVY